MHGWMCRTVMVVVTWAVTWTAVPSAEAASGLFDWLASCGSDRETPVTGYYPVTSTYVSSSTDCCEPTICCDVPCPPLVMPEARPSLWQRLFGCSQSSQASYRTNWVQVPVTSYRPAIATDPLTGGTVTVMQPCTTYTWQPDRQRCSLFDRLCGRCDPAPMAVPCLPSAGMDCSGGIVTSDCCHDTVGSMGTMAPTPAAPAPTPATPPYYTPGAPANSSVLPGTSVPGGATPVLPRTTPPAAGGAAAQPPAADVKPSLKPALDEPGDTEPADSALEAPESATRSPLPSHSVMAPAEDALNPNAIVPLPSLGPPRVNGPGPSISPVPGPDTAPADPEAAPSAPQLLNPRDQVAVLRSDQPWSYSATVWPPRQGATQATSSPSSQRVDRRWDESGWQSVRP